MKDVSSRVVLICNYNFHQMVFIYPPERHRRLSYHSLFLLINLVGFIKFNKLDNLLILSCLGEESADTFEHVSLIGER